MNYHSKIITKYNRLLVALKTYVESTNQAAFQYKVSVTKWSKKEILGHLVDSAVYNHIRFTEIQLQDSLYKVTTYKQDDLVRINQYQQANISDLINLWYNLNLQIKSNIQQLNEQQLSIEIELTDGEKSNLRFLVTDYINHLEHHVYQIIQKNTF